MSNFFYFGTRNRVTRNRIFAPIWGRTRIRSTFDILELTARLSIHNRPMLSCTLYDSPCVANSTTPDQIVAKFENLVPRQCKMIEKTRRL